MHFDANITNSLPTDSSDHAFDSGQTDQSTLLMD